MKICVVWAAAAGCLLGLLGATFVYTVERPTFEGTAIVRPLRPAEDKSGISYREWIQTEAAIMASEANLTLVVRNLNLETEWSLSMGEAIAAIQKRLRVSLSNDTSLVEVKVTGTRDPECSIIANAIVSSREEMWRTLVEDERRKLQQAWTARVNILTKSSGDKREELVEAMRKSGASGDYSDATLIAAALTPEVSKLREAWQEDVRQSSSLKERLAAASLAPVPPRSAEIVQQARPKSLPVGPQWSPRAILWSAIGGAVGLAAGLIAAFLRRTMASNPANASPPPPMALHAADY